MSDYDIIQRNVLGQRLKPCGIDSATGFKRDGYCSCCSEDIGLHTVCSTVTEAFLHFSLSKGNDLITPHPEWRFPGLLPGDHWCLCAQRWLEAFQAGVAPPVYLQATHERSLEVIPLEDLKAHAIVILKS